MVAPCGRNVRLIWRLSFWSPSSPVRYTSDWRQLAMLQPAVTVRPVTGQITADTHRTVTGQITADTHRPITGQITADTQANNGSDYSWHTQANNGSDYSWHTQANNVSDWISADTHRPITCQIRLQLTHTGLRQAKSHSAERHSFTSNGPDMAGKRTAHASSNDVFRHAVLA